MSQFAFSFIFAVVIFSACGARVNHELTSGTTCKRSEYRLCKGDWYWMNNPNCCTDKAVQCKSVSISYCNGDWKWLGNNQCCLTSDQAFDLTCKSSSYQYCSTTRAKADWKWFGGDCCTAKPVNCLTAGFGACNSGYVYLGDDQCCRTSGQEVAVSPTCISAEYNYCKEDWYWMQNPQCCTDKPAQCKTTSIGYCTGGWKWMGNTYKQCCLTADQKFDLTCKRSQYNYCKGDWKWFGGDCCTSKPVTCLSASLGSCPYPWKYLGSNQCCKT